MNKQLIEINIDWKSSMVKELMLCREDELYSNLSSHELNILLIKSYTD